MTFPYVAAGALISSGWGTATSAAAAGGGGGVSAWSGKDQTYDPALPTMQVNVDYSEPTGGTLPVSNQGQLVSALETAAAAGGNRIISITGDFTISGTPVTIPDFTNPVYIMSDAFVSAAPVAAGTRATESNMTGIGVRTITLSVNYALSFAQGARNCRFVGLWFLVTSGALGDTPIKLGAETQTQQSHVPSNIGIDRCICQGPGAAVDLPRFIRMSADSSFVHCSTITAVARPAGSDCQGILIENFNNGPFRITNNAIDGESENLLIGGTVPGLTDASPSNGEIRFNHFYKILNSTNRTKNLFELKCGRNLLIEGNVFDNYVLDAQYSAMALKTSRSGVADNSPTNNVTVRWNCFQNVDSGILLFMGGENDTTETLHDVAVYHNYHDGDHEITQNYGTYAFTHTSTTTNMYNISIRNNTFVGGGHSRMHFLASIMTINNMEYRDCIETSGTYDMILSDDGTAQTAWAGVVASDVTNEYNMNFGGSSGNWSSWATGQQYPTDPAAEFVNWVAAGGGDMSLKITSVGYQAGTGGVDIGCDIARVAVAISGVT